MKSESVFLLKKAPCSAQQCEEELSKLKQLLNSSLDVICAIDTSGRFRFVSAACESVWGYTSEELIGKKYTDIMAPTNRQATTGIAEAIRLRKSIHCFENRYRKKDGTVVPILWSARWNAKEKMIFCIAKDISAQKRRDQKEKDGLCQVYDSIRDCFFSVNRNWVVTHWNKKAEEVLSIPKQAIIGKRLWEVYKEAVNLPCYEAYQRAMRENTVVHFEKYLPSTFTWLAVSAYPTTEGLSVFFQDITTQKKHEMALQEANERYELATKATSDALWDWNLATNEISFNNTFRQNFGYSGTNDKLFAVWAENIHEEDKHKVLDSLQKAIQHCHCQQWKHEYRFYRKNKSIAYILDRGHIIRNKEGVAVRMVGSMQDITRLKETELAVHKSEKRFKAMVQSGNDLVVLLNSSFEIFYTSPNYPEITGYSLEEVSGFLSHEKVHPDDIEKLNAAAAKLFVEKFISLPPFRFRVKSGIYRWFETTLSNQLDNPDLTAIVANVRDITEKMHANEELEKLSLVAKETVNAVVITDAFENITWVNKAFTDITEYHFEEVIGKKPNEFLQGAQTSERTKNYLRKCIEKQRGFQCEMINYTKSGNPYWTEIKGKPLFDENGRLKQFFAIQTDITARKEAEAIIALSEEKYKRLFYHSPQPKWIFKADTYQIIDVNDAACACYGYSREEFLRLNIQELNVTENGFPLTAFAAQNERWKETLRETMPHRKKNGHVFYTEITISSIHLTTGLHYIATGNDMTDKLHLQQQLITEKVAAQKEIARAIIHAQENERNEIGQELHDNVCQLLTTSKLYIENIKYVPDQQEAYLQKARELLLQSINEIRYLSKQLVSPVLNYVGFEHTVQELLSHYQSLNLFTICFQYSANVELLDKNLKTSIVRILQEQFNNTVKYASATEVTLSIFNDNETLVLQYEDNGVGFDPEQEKTGIGLSNIRNRAGAYQGTVRITAAVGRGCKTEVVFPITNQIAHTVVNYVETSNR